MSEPFKSSIRPYTLPATTSISQLTSGSEKKDTTDITTILKSGKKPASVVLKSVKNYSVQGLSLILDTEEGFKELWIEPREVIQVPETFISQQMRNLHRRRLIQISN